MAWHTFSIVIFVGYDFRFYLKIFQFCDEKCRGYTTHRRIEVGSSNTTFVTIVIAICSGSMMNFEETSCFIQGWPIFFTNNGFSFKIGSRKKMSILGQR